MAFYYKNISNDYLSKKREELRPEIEEELIQSIIQRDTAALMGGTL